MLHEDDDEWRTPTEWLFDMVAMPALVVAFTALCVLGASTFLWGCVAVWRAILTT